MDLIFCPSTGDPFTIEVGYFDTVLEIKEKIQKYKGIPVYKQTLAFNGNVLKDDLNIHYSDILDRSHIQLFIAPDAAANRSTDHEILTLFTPDYFEIDAVDRDVLAKEISDKSETNVVAKKHINHEVLPTMVLNKFEAEVAANARKYDEVPVKVSHNSQIDVVANRKMDNEVTPIEISDDSDTDQTASKMTDHGVFPTMVLDNSKLDVAANIREIYEVWPVEESDKSDIHASANRKTDHNVLRIEASNSSETHVADNRKADHEVLPIELSTNSEINVVIQPSPPLNQARPPSGKSSRSRKLRIVVLLQCGKKTLLEVNPSHNIQVLREKLEKMKLDLPKDGYFFIHKQNVMDDDRSFRWHHVCEGDIIEVFPGWVSG